MSRFFKSINYSSCNEDSRSELKALALKPADTVLCITGSGARPLDLLVARPACIVSADINPLQTFLLELKLSAIRHLDYDEFVRFLGVHPANERREIYESIRPGLKDEARRFWDANLRLIESGVIYAGRWERFFGRLAWVAALLMGRRIELLMEARSLDEQAEFWKQSWDDAAWRALLRVSSARPVWKYLLKDPAFYQHVPRGFSSYAYLKTAFDRAAVQMLFRESPMAVLLFRGRFEEAVLPLHLQRHHYPALKALAGRITPVTDSLQSFLGQVDQPRFDAFSLSDVASYTNEVEYAQLWERVIRTANPGARVCERQFLVKRDPNAFVPGRIPRNHALEERLAESDSSIFYSFVAATL